MLKTKKNLKVSVIQLSSVPDFEENKRNIIELLKRTANNGTDLAILPENLFSHGDFSAIQKLAVNINHWGETIRDVQHQAGLSSHIVWGSVPVSRGGRVYNTAIVTDGNGRVVATYEKNNLFSYSGTMMISESDIYSKGEDRSFFFLEGWKIGLSICFDLRYPDFYKGYNFPDIIICAAAFTRKTGEAHWEVLSRARAIENQCYFLAADQESGPQKDFPPTFGHSMIINPWGRIIGIRKKGKGIIGADLKIGQIIACRNKINMGYLDESREL